MGPCHTYCFHLIPVRSARQKRLEWQSSRLAPFGTKHELILTAREHSPLSHPEQERHTTHTAVSSQRPPPPARSLLHHPDWNGCTCDRRGWGGNRALLWNVRENGAISSSRSGALEAMCESSLPRRWSPYSGRRAWREPPGHRSAERPLGPAG